MIITIGRQCGCGADEIGKMLSEKYAIPCYAKSKLLEYAREKELYDKYPYFFGEVPADFLDYYSFHFIFLLRMKAKVC